MIPQMHGMGSGLLYSLISTTNKSHLADNRIMHIMWHRHSNKKTVCSIVRTEQPVHTEEEWDR